MGKIYVILGKAASGKSSIAKDISNDLNINMVVSYTTRAPRTGEINGIDYWFTDKDAFNTDDFICVEQYYVTDTGYQHYGVKLSDLEQVDDVIIVLTPSGYRELKEKFGDRVVGIYIMASQKDRYERYVSRDPHDPKVQQEATRRMIRDDIDFKEFEFEVEFIAINNKAYEQVLDSVRIDIVVDGL